MHALAVVLVLPVVPAKLSPRAQNIMKSMQISAAAAVLALPVVLLRLSMVTNLY